MHKFAQNKKRRIFISLAWHGMGQIFQWLIRVIFFYFSPLLIFSLLLVFLHQHLIKKLILLHSIRKYLSYQLLIIKFWNFFFLVYPLRVCFNHCFDLYFIAKQ